MASMFYYEAISKAVHIPIMVQDAPLMTQVAIPASLLAKMGRHIENVEYAKVEAPPTAPKIGALQDIVAFGGLNGNFFIEEYNRGARGIMPGSDMIDSFACIWKSLEGRDSTAAWKTFTRILPLIRFELQPGLGVSAMKHNLKAAGVIASSHVRHPTGTVDKNRTQRSWISFAIIVDKKNTRWFIAAFIFLASVINYIDRKTLSVFAPLLTMELHMSPVQYSNVLQAFLIAYTIMYLGSGFLVDRWGTKVSLAAFMAFWSVSNMLHAFARTPFQLGIFRALLGIGEPGNFMAGFKAISEWFPPKERAFVNGLQNGGASIGAIIAPPLIVWLTIKFDWRMSFVIHRARSRFGLADWMADNLWNAAVGGSHGRSSAEIRAAVVAPDLGIAVREILLRSSVVVLPVLAA